MQIYYTFFRCTRRCLAAEKNPLSEKNNNFCRVATFILTNLMNSCSPTISGDGYADAAENISDRSINSIRTLYEEH